jgi:hypothetical protein
MKTKEKLIYRKFIDMSDAGFNTGMQQVANCMQFIFLTHRWEKFSFNQGCGSGSVSGSGLDLDSIGSVDPEGQK